MNPEANPEAPKRQTSGSMCIMSIFMGIIMQPEESRREWNSRFKHSMSQKSKERLQAADYKPIPISVQRSAAPQLKETTGGEFRPYNASIGLP